MVESLIDEGNEVLFINANENILSQDCKTWQDVLDVILRSRFKDRVTFLDIGALRRESKKRGTYVCGFKKYCEIILDNKKNSYKPKYFYTGVD